jgi:hypothetical protein
MDRKSRLLSTCLRSVFALPQLDTLEKHTCLFLELPNIQVWSPCCTLSPVGGGGGLLGRASGSVCLARG